MKRENDRTPLQEVIPLSTPYVVHIETNNTCNFKCKFCFESNDKILEEYGIKRGFMKREVFEKIIDDLKAFPGKVKRIYFHVAGEPLLHKDIIHFIQYTKSAEVAEQLVMFTNGVLLTEKLGTELAHSGLDIIQISVEGVSEEKYEEVTGRKIDYEAFIENIRHLYNEKPSSLHIHAKIIDCNLTDEEKNKFYCDFKEISDECYIEQLLDICPSDVMDTTMGNGQSFTQEGKDLKEKLVCTIPFYVVDINYDGTVDACSCDWRRKLIMGNVVNETLYNIWNGKMFLEFRKMQLMGNRKKCLACSDCKAILYQLDDIDTYRDSVLKKIE
jgi:radical SAM protein with 4Fe4S-binding SPASM domain